MNRATLLALTLTLALPASRAAAYCDGRAVSPLENEIPDLIAPTWTMLGEGWIDSARYRFFAPAGTTAASAMIVETIQAPGVIATEQSWEAGDEEFRLSHVSTSPGRTYCAKPVSRGQDIAAIFASIQNVWKQR